MFLRTGTKITHNRTKSKSDVYDCHNFALNNFIMQNTGRLKQVYLISLLLLFFACAFCKLIMPIPNCCNDEMLSFQTLEVCLLLNCVFFSFFLLAKGNLKWLTNALLLALSFDMPPKLIDCHK